MKKINIILFAILAVMSMSCTLEPIFQEMGQHGTTTVTFTPDFAFTDGGPSTKAFTEKPQVRNLYLAVFNEGGKALVEYVKANPVALASENDTQYTYTVTLQVSSKPRVIHFIANAPEELGYGSDVDAVGTLNYSFDKDSWTGQDAYWGYLKLDNGICKEEDANFSNLTAALSSVKLVRNFAMIQVEPAAGSNFTVTRYWLSNFPECSTAAPYNRAARRFETGYAGYDYVTDAMTAGYEGFCPAYSELVSISGMDEDELDAIACGADKAAFTYEREKPVDDPLCIIVGGTSDLCSTETFYKVDLRDENGKYLPVLRNFTYTISIGTVYKVGESTVEAALNSVSSGAIDTDISLQELKDLSNGKSRIAVSETEIVLFEDDPVNLLYSYVPDITTGTVLNRTLAQWVSEGYYTSEAAVLAAHEPYVSIDFEPGMSGKVIDSYSVSNLDESDGYRKVLINPVQISDIVKTEVVTVMGHTWNSSKNKYETLQRTVTFYMRPRLDMVLAISPETVPAAVGEDLTLTIGIEENLPQSLFTLNMKITTEQMTLTPGSNDLPISSEVGADGKPAFFVTRAITWEEYCATPSVMDADGILRKHFDCLFKTNTKNFRDVDPSFGQGDRVIVANDNFNTGNALFMVGNDNLKRFINPHFDKEYLVSGRPSSILFGMTKLPSDGIINVRMMGIEPADSGVLTFVEEEDSGENAGYSVYTMHVTNASSESFSVKPKTGATTAYFQLFKDGEFNNSAKNSIEIKKPGFTNLHFEYKNLDYVVAGKVAQAVFHMDYIPVDSLVTIHLKSAVPADAAITGTAETNGYTAYVIPATANDISLPVKIDPAVGATKAYFKITANDYNDSAEAWSNIQKLNFSNLKLINVNNVGKNYVVGGKPARISFMLDDMPSDNVVTIKLANLTLGTGKTGVSGIVDNGDGTYDLTVTGNTVTLDVTPTVGQTSASYELTDSEFNTNSFSTQIKKLTFDNLMLVNVNNPSKTYVSEGKPARVSFIMEDMPADGNVTLSLTNLTLDSTDPASGKMSGITAVSGGAGTYVLTVSDRTVTIDVTPAADVSTAKFTLTDAEFYDAECASDVRKLEFSNLAFTVSTTPAGYLIAGDSTSKISFSVDQIPTDGNVVLWIKNASVNGLTVAGTPVNGFTPYTVDLTNLTTTLGITVNSTGLSATNDEVTFYLRDEQFADSDDKSMDVRIRYAVDWSDVLFKTDVSNAAVASQTIDIYTNAACTTAATVTSVTTNQNGYATNGMMNIDAVPGSENYYFKFTKGDYTYISDAVTLAQLAAGTTVICKDQPKTYTIASNTLRVYVNGSVAGSAVSWSTSGGKSGSFNVVTNGNPNGRGYNSSAISILCTRVEDITFKSGSYTYTCKIGDVLNGGTIYLN